MNKKIKIVLTTSAFALVSSASIITYAVAPLILSSDSKSQMLGTNYNFDNKTFQTKSDLINYAKSAYFLEDQSSLNRFKWSIKDGNEIKYFSDPKLLNDYLTTFISEENLFASVDIKTNNLYNEIDAKNLSHLYKDEKSTTIFRGKNNSIYTNELDAKNSYLSIHDAYYFNNLYFNNIENLKLYLESVYYAENGEGFNNTNKKNKVLGIKAPNLDLNTKNDLVSAGINAEELFNSTNLQNKKIKNSRMLFSNFIKSNAKEYLEITNSPNLKQYVDLNKIKNWNYSDLNTNLLEKPVYTKVDSNNGVGNYIVDLNQEDDNTLFGPYYISSPATLEAIINPKSWDPIKEKDPLIYSNNNAELIANFINLFLFPTQTDDENNINIKSKPLNISVFDKEITKYLTKLENSYPYVYNAFNDFAINIKKGKKYNNFNGLILSYIFLIENLIYVEANQNIIDDTKDLFNDIAAYLDKILKRIFSSDDYYFLKHKTNTNNKANFSFENLFDFKNNDFNLNIKLSYFVDEIQQNYPRLINALTLISFASCNATNSLSLVPFNKDFLNERYTSNNKNTANNPFEQIDTQNFKQYENLWNLFSSSNVDDFISKLPKDSNSNVDDNQIAYGVVYLPQIISTSIKTSFEFLIKDFKDKKIEEITDSDKQRILDSFELKLTLNESNSILQLILDLINFENITPKLLFAFVPFFKENDFSFISSILKNDKFETESEILDKLNKKNKNKNLDSYTKSMFYISSPLNYLDLVMNTNDFKKVFDNEITKSTTAFNSNNTNRDFKELLSTSINSLDKILSDSNLGDLSNKLKKLKNIIKIFAVCSAYLEIGLAAWDLITGAFVPKTEIQSYVFRSDDSQVKYIWNGGFKTTMLWGLVTLDSHNIDDMHLIAPQQVTKLHKKTTLYYNEKHYSEQDRDSLKKDQLIDMLNGEYVSKSKQIKKVYSFDSKLNENNIFDKIGKIEDENTLVGAVYKSIKNDYLSGKQSSNYFTTMFSFANGQIVTNNHELPKVLAKKVVSKIKPVKIALLPKLAPNSKNPISLDSGEIDNSLAPYRLPGTSWDFSGENTNENDNKYIIIDPNIGESNNNSQNNSNQTYKSITSNEVIKKLKTAFYSYFDVESKEVLSYELTNNNLYSAINNNIILHYVYKTKVKNKQTKYFLNKVDAFNYLLNDSDFKVYEYTETNEVYKYQDQVFNSRIEFLEFVLEAAKTEGGK